MIPILYEATERNFTTNGLGRLADAVECTTTEEEDSTFELFMRYPVGGAHYSDLAPDRWIYAPHDDTKKMQPFRIYKISKPINGIVSVYAEHAKYLLNKTIVAPFTAGSCSAAIAGLANNAIGGTEFTFWTDKTVTGNFKVEQPQSIGATLAGQAGSILDVYGKGDYEWDHFTVKLYLNRGSDRDVTLRYGKNITDITADADMTNTYTAIIPFWKNDETTVMLPEKILYADTQYSTTLAKAVDFSSEWEEEPTETQLRTRAQKYLDDNAGWEIKQNIKVSFVQLYQTAEYENYAPLQRVNLCDTVSVYYEPLGVTTKSKVVKTVYNVLLERYDEIEIGAASSSTNEAVSEIVNNSTKDLATVSFLQKSVARATSLITGGLGGYVKFTLNADGEPEEILIMDTPDVNTAVNVWRWNKNGLGYSSTGYDGDYRLAITADGHIIADFIDTGYLSANRIRAGILTALSGYIQFNLDTGFIYAKDISLPLWGQSGRFEAIKMDGSGFKFCRQQDGAVATTLESTGLYRRYDYDGTQFGIWLSSGSPTYYDTSIQLLPDEIYLSVSASGGKVVIADGTSFYASPTQKGLTGTANVTDSTGNSKYMRFHNGILVSTNLFTDTT